MAAAVMSIDISTHILTKRMTEKDCNGSVIVWISTHILTKRMTGTTTDKIQNLSFQLTSSRRGWPLCSLVPLRVLLFQLTSSRRGWQLWLIPNKTTKTISTHILTKRMTGWLRKGNRTNKYFNSHPHEEDDRDTPWNSFMWWYFNSHPHEEDDVFPSFPVGNITISTHILTKRMTLLHP